MGPSVPRLVRLRVTLSRLRRGARRRESRLGQKVLGRHPLVELLIAAGVLLGAEGFGASEFADDPLHSLVTAPIALARRN
jgi:hypothetical protein